MPDAIAIAEADQGRTIQAPKGALLTVTLAENRTTGFSWRLEPYTQDVLALESNDYDPPASAAVGAGGTRRVCFRAVADGKAALCLRYRRSWEPPEKPAKEFSVEIIVK
jgi:inhibitor of cysteine peptidase